ncbi:TetR/AcrR family transcriptional regulator [Nocardioides sp.]|uniref:TetR/AcrR family transcriptional regulator n=1 Tax=Nocardioides sp. TaxID=35761 RepID=UPI0027345006|nr:TetR family transcriptional regulator C-terminal domain-containing protein [Nocardioides sp.]MDP3892996.1 TetR family transcriptional regulator C-terminal domain-containing protein [Nocardioides sp.]
MARMSADERRERLVEAAITVMTRDGVARATTRAIVAEAEMPLGVFHYCFASKKELVEQVIGTINAHAVSRVMAMTDTRATFRESLRASVQGYWEHVLTHPAEHMLTYELTQYALRQPGFEGVARTQYELYLGTLTAFLDDIANRLAVTYELPTPVLARYLMTVVDGLTLNWIILGGEPEAAAVLDHVTDHVAGLVRERS